MKKDELDCYGAYLWIKDDLEGEIVVTPNGKVDMKDRPTPFEGVDVLSGIIRGSDYFRQALYQVLIELRPLIQEKTFALLREWLEEKKEQSRLTFKKLESELGDG